MPLNSDIHKAAMRYIWCLFLLLFLCRYSKANAVTSALNINGSKMNSA